MERILALGVIVLLVCCFASGLLALRSWAETRDLWGLYFAALCISAGYAAQRLVDPFTKGGGA